MQKQKNLSRIALFLIAFLLMYTSLLPIFVNTNVLAANNSEKWTICHATSAENNPFVRIVVSNKAQAGHFDNNGTTTAGHEDDILLTGEVDCPEDTITPIPTVTSVPTATPTPTQTPTPTRVE